MIIIIIIIIIIVIIIIYIYIPITTFLVKNYEQNIHFRN